MCGNYFIRTEYTDTNRKHYLLNIGVKILVLYLIRKDLYTTVPVVTLGAKYNTQVGKKIEERDVKDKVLPFIPNAYCLLVQRTYIIIYSLI